MKFELIDVSTCEGLQSFYYHYSHAIPLLFETMELFDENPYQSIFNVQQSVLQNSLKFWHWETKAFCFHEEKRSDWLPDTIRVTIGIGRDANSWAHSFLYTLDEYARENKFQRLEVYSRLGWEKIKARREDSVGYDVSRIVYKKKLK